MSVNKITRKIFSNSRIELDLFMYLPSGVFMNSERSLMNINCNPVLYLRYKHNKYVNEEYDYTKASFKITPRNLYEIVKLFNTVMKWFFDDQYNDIFLNDPDTGNIVFNADYNKLSAKTHRGDYDTQILQVIPSVIRLGDKTYEGVHLYVNTSQYCIPLTFQEVSIIFGILKEFNFTNEITATLTMYEYIERTKSYGTLENKTSKTPFD